MKKIVDVSLPIGPVHPVFKEPCRIKCEMRGEQVLSAELELGYVKKGIERIMVGRPWQEVMFLAERVCGICSVVHNYVCIEGMERISDIEVPDRAAYLRVILNEMDRIQSHLLANYSYCYTIEHETLAMYLINLRETTMDALEMITGARVTCSYIIPGGVRFDLTPEKEKTLRGMLDHIDSELTRFVNMFKGGPMIALRSKNIGNFTREEAIESHAVGPTARASNLNNDCRLFHPTYKNLGFEFILLYDGDNYARIMLRFLEIFQSTELIRSCLAQMEPGIIRGGGIIGGGTSKWSGEAPRGELTYDISTDIRGRIKTIGIRTPSIMNIEACVHYMLKGVDSSADVTSTYISSDPCIACNER